MTENEASVRLEVIRAGLLSGIDAKIVSSEENIKAITVIINALEEIQQYRAISTVEELQEMKKDFAEALSDWRQYRKVGTLEECRAAVEKQTAISREVIEGKYFCPKCHNLMPYPGYCGCGQKVY